MNSVRQSDERHALVSASTSMEVHRRGEPPEIAFLSAASLRSGTNYIGAMMATHPDVATVPEGNSTSEVRLVATLSGFVGATEQLRHLSRGLPDEMFTWPDIGPAIGDAFVTRLWEAAGPQTATTMFLKDPNADNLSEMVQMMPDARYLVVVRDGRDTVASLLGLPARRSRPPVRRVLRRLSKASGRDTVTFVRGWAAAARSILRFEASPECLILGTRYERVRYEDLVADPRAAAQRIFQFYGLRVDEEILDAAAAVQVMGSTFLRQEQRAKNERPTFEPIARDSSFKPVGRWESWPRRRVLLFDRLAGAELTALGYQRSR